MGGMARPVFGTIIASAAMLLAPLGVFASGPTPPGTAELRVCDALEQCLADPPLSNSEFALLRCEAQRNLPGAECGWFALRGDWLTIRFVLQPGGKSSGGSVACSVLANRYTDWVLVEGPAYPDGWYGTTTDSIQGTALRAAGREVRTFVVDSALVFVHYRPAATRNPLRFKEHLARALFAIEQKIMRRGPFPDDSVGIYRKRFVAEVLGRRAVATSPK